MFYEQIYCMKSLCQNFKPKSQLCNFCAKILYKKCTHKTLMKFTKGVNFTNIFWAYYILFCTKVLREAFLYVSVFVWYFAERIIAKKVLLKFCWNSSNTSCNFTNILWAVINARKHYNLCLYFWAFCLYTNYFKGLFICNLFSLSYLNPF